MKFNYYSVLLLCTLPLFAYPASTNQQVINECKRISGKLASVNLDECLDRNLELTEGRSVKSAPILMKEYPPIAPKIPKAKVLLIGGIHGDEYSSVTIVFKWMTTLDKYHSGLFHWHIIPLLNPDGLLRKKSQRINENGVDLNRNFPMPDWENATRNYWVNRTYKNPRRFPGNKALSEPETKWLVKTINELKPDVIVAVHAPHGIIDYDGPEDGPYKLGRLYLNLIGTYPGSLGNYAGIQSQIPVVTIELPYAGIMPTKKEVNDIWRDLVRWLRKNVPPRSQSVHLVQDIEPS